MDIQTSFNSQMVQTMKTLVENNLNLTVGQQLVTKVANVNTSGIMLRWGGQSLTVENQNSRATFTPYVGQNVTLQVARTSPELEFKLVTFDTPSHEGLPSAEKMNAMRLTLSNAPFVSRIDESMKNFASHVQNQQPVEAKVVGLVGNKIQLELIIDDNQNTANGKKMLISIDRNQLQLLPSQSESLKVGQALTLSISKIGATPEFKQLATVMSAATIQEEKIATFMKQFLPRHESPTVLLNQLKTDLPQLGIKDNALSTTLKQNAAALFEHLSPKEQLFNPQKLKHLIYSSGLFFEAKSAATNVLKQPSSIAQSVQQQQSAPPVDLKMPLLNLLQHTSSTNELKQLTSTLLQNLLKQESTPNPELAATIYANKVDLNAQLLQMIRPENIPQSFKNVVFEIFPNLKESNETKASDPPVKNATVNTTTPPSDFKNDLFKLLYTLKQSIAQKTEFALSEKQLEVLQQLHNKTEQALAKVVLDQLHSVPKEETGKQVWNFDLPFFINNQIESLRLEVQRDKTNESVDTQAHWLVNLTLLPPQLGEVQCVISYQNGVVNTYFKNQHPHTTALISQHLDHLKYQLHSVGLVTGSMSAHNNFQPIKSAYSVSGTSLLNETV